MDRRPTAPPLPHTTALASGVVAVQWHAVFDDALRSAAIIAVGAAVRDYVRRTPTEAELSAARRAANRYATTSNVQLVRVSAPMGGRGIRTVLLLARADADLGDPERLRDIATGRSRPAHQGKGTRNVSQRAETLVTTLTKAARTARLLSAGQLEPDHAAALSSEMAVVLPDLLHLQQRLHLQGQRHQQGLPGAQIAPGTRTATAGQR